MEATGQGGEAALANERHHNKVCPALPDLEHEKAAILTSLTSRDAQRGCRAIDQFVDWYCGHHALWCHRTQLWLQLL
jgi:hypothetical protein